jgi:hypothetical protein
MSLDIIAPAVARSPLTLQQGTGFASTDIILKLQAKAVSLVVEPSAIRRCDLDLNSPETAFWEAISLP